MGICYYWMKNILFIWVITDETEEKMIQSNFWLQSLWT